MDRPHPTLDDRGLRKLAAAGALLHIATFVASVVISGQPVVHAGLTGIEHSLVERGPWPVMAGMFLLALGFLSLLVTITYLSLALGGRSPAACSPPRSPAPPAWSTSP